MLPLLLSLSLAAPAPKHKPLIRPPLHAHVWKMRWGGTQWEHTRFAKDGYYQCGLVWVGRWYLKGDTLFISEQYVNSDSPVLTTYVIKLEPGKWEGKITKEGDTDPSHAIPFKLER